MADRASDRACVLRILEEGGRVVAADISERDLADTATKAGDVGGPSDYRPQLTSATKNP